jgi:hypothetical protein
VDGAGIRPGRNWTRIVSTVLFGVATLDLTGAFGPPGVRVSLIPTVFGPTIPVLYWLVGLVVVCLLWRPASQAYFRPPGYARAQHQAQMDELDHQAQMAKDGYRHRHANNGTARAISS